MNVVIASTARTAIGRAGKGSFVDVRVDDLLAHALRAAVEKIDLDPTEVEDVVVGHAMPYGEGNALNIARGASFLAGLPDSVGGATVNRFCSSSLEAIRIAAHSIAFGEGDVFVCGGVESVSRCVETPNGEMAHPKFISDEPLRHLYMSMGMTAEVVADRFDVSREDMDRYAQQSQVRAVSAQKSGFFEREIVPYRKPDGTVVDLDDGPRPSSTLEKLAALPPSFKENGRVTAGNSCPLNDGAAAVVVMSEDKSKALGIPALARIKSSAVAGLDPQIMGVGPIAAVRKALRRAGMTIDDVDVVELNEAFASQVLAVCRELSVDPFSDKLNPHGGAIALGHPFGQTGCRIMTTLINDLQSFDKTIGVETMCVGGGEGLAMVIERLS